MERSDILMRMLSPKLRYSLAVAVLAVAAMAIAAAVTEGPTFLSAQTAEPPVVEQTEAAATEVEIQRRFNELRREVLDDRSDTIDWWLTAIAIFVTLRSRHRRLGYIGFNRFREIEAEARQSVKEAKEAAEQAALYVERIKKKVDEAEALVEGATSKDISDPAKTERIGEAVQEVRSDPAASPLALGIADAYLLQQEGKSVEAAEKWRAIATLIQGINDSLAARAWLSVGYLLQEGKHGEAFEASAGEVLSAYNNALALRPGYAEVYNDRGALKGRLGQYEDATADLDQAIHLDPDLAEAYINRGKAKHGAARHEDAIADFDQAIRLRPDLAQAYSNRGATKNILGRYEDAIADFDRVIRIDPDHAEGYFYRGNANLGLGRHEAAVADYTHAIRLNSEFVDAYSNRAVAKRAMGRHEDAIADFDQVIHLRPDDAEAYSRRGNAQIALEQYDDAIADYDQAIRLKPDHVEAYVGRGNARHRSGLYEDAIADYDQAIRLRPDYATVYSDRGNAKHLLGRYSDVISDCDEATRLDPNLAQAYLNRGAAKAALRDIEGSRSDLETALDLAEKAGNDGLKAVPWPSSSFKHSTPEGRNEVCGSCA